MTRVYNDQTGIEGRGFILANNDLFESFIFANIAIPIMTKYQQIDLISGKKFNTFHERNQYLQISAMLPTYLNRTWVEFKNVNFSGKGHKNVYIAYYDNSYQVVFISDAYVINAQDPNQLNYNLNFLILKELEK